MLSVQLPAAVALVTTAETVAIVLPPNAVGYGSPAGRLIKGFLNILAGTGTTGVQIRVRQGTTTAGALVGSADLHTLAAAATASIPFAQVDTAAAAPAGNQYCVTVQQVAATANGTVNDGNLEIDNPVPSVPGD